MNGRDLYKEIGMIDDDLVEEAAKRKKRRHRYFLAGGAVAACIALGVTGIVWQQGYFNHDTPAPGVAITDTEQELTAENKSDINNKMTGETTEMSQYEDYTLEFQEVAGFMDADWYIEGHFWENITDEELDSVCSGLKEFPDYVTPRLEAHYDGYGELKFVEGWTETLSGGECYIQIAPGEVVMDCILESDSQKMSEILGVQVNAAYYENSYDNTTTYLAEFKIDEVSYYVKLSGGEREKEMLPKLVAAIISCGKADFSVLHPTVPEWREESPTETEAYQDEEFGGYLPKNIPEGFTFEYASRIYYEGTETREETNYLSACWKNGMNQIWINVSYLEEADKVRMTSAADTTNYDLNLYPIPRAESVPDELREIVDNPIFNIEELTEDVVNKRAYRVEDAGDTKGYRMEFSVLYQGDVLVEIDVKGVNPVNIYLMLKEI